MVREPRLFLRGGAGKTARGLLLVDGGHGRVSARRVAEHLLQQVLTQSLAKADDGEDGGSVERLGKARYVGRRLTPLADLPSGVYRSYIIGR